jgi:putative ABC transport system permease protein
MLGVAVGVVLIIVTVGLARGILYDAGQREKNVGAEIIFQSPGGFGGMASSPMALPVAYCGLIKQVEGVQAVTPVGRFLRSGASGIGFEIIEGIATEPTDQYASYAQISGIHIVEGHDITGDDEVLIDRQQATTRRFAPGSTVRLFDREFRVAGIYEPGSGARIKMRLGVMEQLLGAPNKCSSILVKCANPDDQDAVALRINERIPGNRVVLSRDIPNYYENGFPGLTVFLRVVMGLATIISALVILLAMYTAVTERTREIGILKSLGASKGFILRVIEQEALLISALGALVGFILALLTRLGITTYTTLLIRFEVKWLLTASAVALMGGALGALYPALRAANQDPVKALSYE